VSGNKRMAPSAGIGNGDFQMTKTLPFDPAEHLQSRRGQAELLRDAFASGNAAYIAAALGTVARALGFELTPRKAGKAVPAKRKVA